MATMNQVTAVLRFLAATYPRYQMTEGTIAAYSMGLDDIPADALEMGARQLSRSSKWFPALSELREAALEHAERQEDDEDMRRMARRLLLSWHCCPTCWQHPCACHPELTADEPVALEASHA